MFATLDQALALFKMPTCCWGLCSNGSSLSVQNETTASNELGVHFFPFPILDVKLVESWIAACGLDIAACEKNLDNFYVCSKHFVDGRPTGTNPSPIHWTTQTLSNDSTSSVKSFSPPNLKIYPKREVDVEYPFAQNVLEPGVSEILEQIGPSCIKEEVIDEESLLAEGSNNTLPSNCSNTIKGFQLNMEQGYSIIDLQKLNGPSLFKLFAMSELLPSGYYKFSCHISNSECLRSHASKDENEGRDLIIAHLLNHVETYRSKLKKDPSLHSRRFYPHVHIKLEPELIDVDNPFPDEENKPFPSVPIPPPFDNFSLSQSDVPSFSSDAAEKEVGVPLLENSPPCTSGSQFLQKRTSSRIAERELLKKQKKEIEQQKLAQTKLPKVVIRDVKLQKKTKKGLPVFDDDVPSEKPIFFSKHRKAHYKPPRTYTRDYAMEESSSDSDSSEGDYSLARRKVVFNRNHTLASALRNRNHQYPSKVSRKKKRKKQDDSGCSSDNSSDDGYSRVKRPTKKPANVVFKICNDGSLAIAKSVKEKCDRNKSVETPPDTKADKNSSNSDLPRDNRMKDLEVSKNVQNLVESSNDGSDVGLSSNQEPAVSSSAENIPVKNSVSFEICPVDCSPVKKFAATLSEVPIQNAANVITDQLIKESGNSDQNSFVKERRLFEGLETPTKESPPEPPAIDQQFFEGFTSSADLAPPEPPAIDQRFLQVDEGSPDEVPPDPPGPDDDDDVAAVEQPCTSSSINPKKLSEGEPSEFAKVVHARKSNGPRILQRQFTTSITKNKVSDSGSSKTTSTLKEKNESKSFADGELETVTTNESGEKLIRYVSSPQGLLAKKRQSRKQNLAENLKEDNEFETAEKALLGIFNDHCYTKQENSVAKKRTDNILYETEVEPRTGIPKKKYASWLGNSIDSLLDTHKKAQEIEKSHKPSEDVRCQVIGGSSRKIEPASDPKIKAKALRLISELRHRKPKEVMVCTVRVEDSSRSSYVVQDFYTCEICGKRFTAPNSLYGHYRGHAGIKPFRCDICGQTFTRSHSLSYHYMIHNNTSRFKCKFCGKKFRHPTHYKEHLNRHTGLEPYKCSDCHRRFRTRNTFRRHAMTKHNKVLTPMGSYSVNSKVLQTITWDK